MEGVGLIKLIEGLQQSSGQMVHGQFRRFLSVASVKEIHLEVIHVEQRAGSPHVEKD
jgi:hypothetical protein